MIFTAKTAAEAKAIATDLRAAHADTDWTVRIELPLFDGDEYRIVVS